MTSDRQYREQQRRAKAAVFKEVDNMQAAQRAAGGDPSQNRSQYPELVIVDARVTRDMHYQLQQIARQNRLSMRRLVMIGLELVLHQAAEGTLPKVPSWPLGPDQD